MELSHRLGKELKALRERAGLTQNQLAVKIGKDMDYISKIERGKRIPSIKTLHQISQVLDIKMYEIMERIDV